MLHVACWCRVSQGVLTDDTYGDAKLLPTTTDSIKERFDKIDPNVVAVVTGFLGEQAVSVSVDFYLIVSK